LVLGLSWDKRVSNSLTGLNLSETIMINVNSMKDNCLDLNL